MQKQHYRYVDIAKGIVIILMVLGHSTIPKYIHQWIFSFHMPFFFLISGLMTNWGKMGGHVFISKKTKALLQPFVIYSIIVLILTPLYSEKTIIEHVQYTLRHGWEGMALWFVPVLWMALVLSYLCLQSKHASVRWGLCTIWLVVTYLNNYHYELPWTLCTVPFATTFVMIGAIAKEHFMKLGRMKNMSLFGILVICAPLSAIAPLVSRVDMSSNIAEGFVCAYVGAISGSLSILVVCMLVDKATTKTKWMQSVGKNTFVVVAFSQIIIMAINYQEWFIDSLAPLKYAVLLVVLVAITYMKNFVVRTYKNLYSLSNCGK